MNLAETSVQRPVTILVITVLLILVGMVMVPEIAVDMFPEVDPPFMMVQTTYAGASPQEVEQTVTERLEKQLSNVSGLQTMTSTSSAGSSRIMLEFGYDRDMTDATNDVRDSLEIVANALPDDAGAPVIMKFDAMGSSIMRLTMSGDETPDTLKRLAEDVIQPRLERLEGVASADVSGGEVRAVRVDLSLNRLAAYGLTASEVTTALAAQNLQMSGGSLTVTDTEYDLRVDERYTSLEEIARTVVATLGGESSGSREASVNRSRVVRLEDVAMIYEGTEERSSAVYVNGRPAILLEIRNESDTNTVQIAQEVRDALEGINAELPEGVSVGVLYDETTYIDSVMSQVYTSAWQGVLLAMAVLFLFLRNWRTTLIIGLSIPIAIIVTMMFMYFFDLTLNMISLTGLILGLGMIVDNSIVILENIYKYRESGAKPRPSAILGSREMMTAITASTLTTLSVFIPMIVWRDDLEMLGEIFSDLIFTVVIALSVSLVVAITIVPALSANFIGIYTATQRTIRNRLLRRLDHVGARVLETVEAGYTRALRFSLRNRALVLTLVVTILGLSVATFSQMGFSFAPQGVSDDAVRIELSMPVGTTLDRSEAVLLQMKEIIEDEIQGYENIIVSVGGGPQGGGSSGSIEITLPQPDAQIMTAAEVKAAIQPHVTAFPEGEFTFSAGRGFGSGSALDVTVASNNLDLAWETATQIRDLILERVPAAENVETDLDAGVPEYRIVIDRDRAALYGLTVQSVAHSINDLVDGSTPTTYWDDATELNVIVQLAEEDRATIPDLDALFIRTAGGERIALSNIASFRLSQGPKDINRENETRVIHVTADVVAGAAATEVMPLIQRAVLEEIVIPDGVDLTFGGETSDIRDLIGPLLLVVSVAILLIFGVMASQFESLSDPFIVFFSIPLLFIGVVAVYTITGEPFSLFSVIGMVVLAGIVVNNGIVLVDYTNLLRRRGMPLYQAVVEAGHSRLRPVLMTSLTTILGMVPLGFFPGEGTEMIRPIGQTIVGGLAASTLITLFVTPVVYTIVNRERPCSRNGIELARKALTAALVFMPNRIIAARKGDVR